ncbi:hypothetical protein BU24DRAFT_458424 [Aaosphaeria arxii CBS 175.79]|uniref:Metallothionein-I gene transcription activator n=1 Tax=Aaosphaeria arxii CBS 175.79 TaxID=1450172 RepID=A0A6A5XZN9_9PLEO|nr:uncharacterized protein BU24DRAFT_458424 [Aaosphaeria arxii CBS 175.79]KAF2018672.1 hypothetical protein BU24DRAFT_458424 [Aaosphaeria arxii CBS 175.79]
MSSYNPASNTGAATGAQQTGSITDDRSRAVEYTCGDCDSPVALKRGEPIRCKNCGHRVLYKQRTNRLKLAEPTIPAAT